MNSQCTRVLAVLADGAEHEMREIHQRAGFMRLNSRVSELRSRGHNIVCRKQGGGYYYRLLATAPGSDLPGDSDGPGVVASGPAASPSAYDSQAAGAASPLVLF